MGAFSGRQPLPQPKRSRVTAANTPLNILPRMSRILLWIRPLVVPIYMTADSLAGESEIVRPEASTPVIR
jgi:hypothetical protein